MKGQNDLAVLLGGALGGSCRAGLGIIFSGPLATTLVNVSGSFLLAWLTFGLFASQRLRNSVTLGLGTGMLGAFTTYATFAATGWQLLNSRPWLGAAFLGLNLGGGLAGAGLGCWLARFFREERP